MRFLVDANASSAPQIFTAPEFAPMRDARSSEQLLREASYSPGAFPVCHAENEDARRRFLR